MTFRAWFDGEKKDLVDGFVLYPKRKILFLLLGIFLLVWALFKLWLVINVETVTYWDHFVLTQIRQTKEPVSDTFFSFLTDFGSGIFIIVVFLILAAFLFKKRRRRAAITVLFTLLGSSLVGKFLNTLFGRPRPFGCVSGILGESCFSFPSGHALASFYFYGILFYLIVRFANFKKTVVLALGLIFATLIFLIGLSRIYLGFHFPSDVLAGFLFGGIWLLIGIISIDFFYSKTV